jgi:hypothetical protein
VRDRNELYFFKYRLHLVFIISAFSRKYSDPTSRLVEIIETNTGAIAGGILEELFLVSELLLYGYC